MEPNAKWFALRVTVQSLDFMGDLAYLLWACTWEMAERPVTTINTPTAVAEIILTAMKNNRMTYSFIAKIYVNET